MGKADLGEAAKGMALVFMIGLILAVIGGLLLAMVGNDNTDYADVTLTSKEKKDTPATANKLIGEMHNTGKGFVGLAAFWLPIIGVILIAVGLGTLNLKSGFLLYVLLASLGLAVALILAYGSIPLYVMIVGFAIAFSADIISTAKSKRFPEHERNPVIAKIYRNAGIRKAWVAYAATYALIVIVGFTILDNAYVVFAILASVHSIAAICNMRWSGKKDSLHEVVTPITPTAKSKQQ